MTLKIINGDIVDLIRNGELDVVVHGCNCLNVMGKGVAKSLRDAWPGVFKADKLATEQWKIPIAKLGNFSTYTGLTENSKPFVIVNAYTQLDYGYGKDRFEYESFSLILRKLETLDKSGKIRWGIPNIGMNNAGGDPERIIPMLEDFATRHDTTLVKFMS